MPTYDYVCLSCNNRFEEFQGINDDVLETCPECEGNLKRVISGGAGFIMKGGSSVSGEACQKPSCGMDTTCCGSEFTCGNTEGCGHHQ